VPSFRTTVVITVDGERYQVRTHAGDQLNAERQIGKNPADTPVELGMRVWWNALKRTYPDAPPSKSFRTFVDGLDEADELEPKDEDEPDALDPTLEAGSDS
jgi:hypothetical protein